VYAGAAGAPGATLGGMTKHLLTLVLLPLVTAFMWLAWLGWDHEYYQVDGVAQGPYRDWQVAGCGVTIVVAIVLAWALVRRPWAILAIPLLGALGVAVPWSIDAARTDETGLWLVGLLMLLIGGGVGLLVVTSLASVFLKPRSAA
jgi:hypothetical protein